MLFSSPTKGTFFSSVSENPKLEKRPSRIKFLEAEDKDVFDKDDNNAVLKFSLLDYLPKKCSIVSIIAVFKKMLLMIGSFINDNNKNDDNCLLP